MSKVSGKIRAMERRQAAMEESLGKIDKHQDLHSRQMLLTRLQLRQNNKYMKSIHEHFMGSKKGRKGIFTRIRVLEVRQKSMIGVASVVISALIIGLVKALM